MVDALQFYRTLQHLYNAPNLYIGLPFTRSLTHFYTNGWLPPCHRATVPDGLSGSDLGFRVLQKVASDMQCHQG